jgi:hypothetical protein
MTSGGVKIIPMLLMPISNIISWYFILNFSNNFNSLLSIVWKITLFYTLWALYNKYFGGKPQELGHISLGLLTLTCLLIINSTGNNQFFSSFFNTSSNKNKIPFLLLLFSCGLVVLNFAIVIPLIISMKGPTQFASKVFKEKDRNNISIPTRVWGYIFTVYIISNVILWSYVFYQFYVLFDIDGGGGSGGSGSGSLLSADIHVDDEENNRLLHQQAGGSSSGSSSDHQDL